MPNKRISELTELTIASPTDELAIVNADETKKIQVKNLIPQDTGWIDINLNTGYPVLDYTLRPQYRKIGDMVHLRGTLYIAPLNFDSSNLAAANIGVDNTYVSVVGDALTFKVGVTENIALTAAPPRTFVVPGILCSRRYEATGSDGTRYWMPISTVLTLIISPTGEIRIASVKDVEDYSGLMPGSNSSNTVFGAHPYRLLTTNLASGDPFPDFSNASLANATTSALELPPYLTVTAPENIDTTKPSMLGGFSIKLDGMTYLTGATLYE
jgi:hypothetical protein